MTDLSRLAIHTQTIKAWDLRTCIDKFVAAGVAGIGVWRHLIDPGQGGVPPEDAARMLADSGLRVPSLVRAGFFVSPDANTRAASIDDANRAIEEARTINAEQIVLVVGAHPEIDLDTGRAMVRDAIASLAPMAASAGVALSIEPLHPQYAADRSCVNTLASALDLCEEINHPSVGVAVDVYHVWWEPGLEAQITRAADAGRLLGFHVCDWKPDQADPLNDRGLMGDGCAGVSRLTRMVDRAGFGGMREVEVFSDRYWAMDPDAYLALIVERYREHCAELGTGGAVLPQRHRNHRENARVENRKSL